MGSTVNDMQLGCLWQGDYILTVSFSGNVNYLDRANPSSPSRVIMVRTEHAIYVMTLNNHDTMILQY